MASSPSMPLQTVTIILAVIDMVFGAIALALFTIALFAVTVAQMDLFSGDYYITQNTQLTIILSAATFVIMCQLCVTVYLWRSGTWITYREWRIWIIISATTFMCAIISVGVSISAGVAALAIVFNVFGLCYRLYGMLADAGTPSSE